jgi:hypothetical protein
MNWYLFEGETSAKDIMHLLKYLNETEGEIILGFCCYGGTTAIGHWLIDRFDAMKDRLTLVAVGGIYSMGFEVWYKYDGRKEVSDETIGMIHLGGLTNVNVSATGIVEPVAVAWIPIMKEMKKRNDRWVKSILSPAEFKEYQKNTEIYIDTTRLREIAKTHNDLIKPKKRKVSE